jgi:glycosyltransferase involved in cell wall biosynthesis
VNDRHVVHVVRSDGFAGVERYIADAAAELSRRGWRVTVIGGDPAAMRRELPDQVAHEPAATVGQTYRALRSVGRCDIVHAHMTAAELPAALLKKRARARLVVTRHFVARRGSSPAGRVAARLIERRMDLQIATSRFVAAATSSPSVVVHNGVRTSDEQADRELVVVMMQRLEREKDTATAIRAWAVSGLAGQGWRLTVHGNGSEQGALRELCTSLGVADAVELAGFTDDARTALRSAEIFLTTAVADAFGLAVVEAMAEATPVVATGAGAHPETLGVDGAYFEVGDADGCAAALNRLAAAPEERRAIGVRLRDRQRQLFSIESHVDQLESLYRVQLAHRDERERTHG